MVSEVKEFKRIEIFNHYHSFNNPFLFITTKIDVDNIVKYCKENGNFYASFGYLITKAANEVDGFKYRYKDGKIYYCDVLKSNYTQQYADGDIGYFTLPAIDEISDYDKYIEEYKRTEKKFLDDNKYSAENDIDEIWLSCDPWFSSTSIIPPFNKEITIPQFIWDKYENIDGRFYLHLTIMVHHGFADGSHVGKFVDLLKENIKNFK